jgi:hypothetical protein
VDTSSPPPSGPEPLPFDDSADAFATAFVDPHLSKLAPDDPRLQLPRAGGRTLRKGPVMALATGVLTALTAAAGFALQPAAGPSAAKPDPDPAASTQPPIIPETIRAAAVPPPGALAAPVGADAGEPAQSAPRSSGAAPAYASAAERQNELRAEEDQKALAGPILFETHGGAAPQAPFASPPAGVLPTAPAPRPQRRPPPRRSTTIRIARTARTPSWAAWPPATSSAPRCVTRAAPTRSRRAPSSRRSS